jgi:hypothetical protein
LHRRVVALLLIAAVAAVSLLRLQRRRLSAYTDRPRLTKRQRRRAYMRKRRRNRLR